MDGCDNDSNIASLKIPNEEVRMIFANLWDASKLHKEFWDNMNNPKKVNINLLSEDDVQTLVRKIYSGMFIEISTSEVSIWKK